MIGLHTYASAWLFHGCFLVKRQYVHPTVEQFVCQSCHNSVGCSSSEIHCNVFEHILSSSGIRGNVLLALNWFPSGSLDFLPEFLSPFQKKQKTKKLTAMSTGYTTRKRIMALHCQPKKARQLFA